MNEIDKMYENAGIEKRIEPRYSTNCEYFEIHTGYPPFTAEKELKLIKWFAHSGHFSHQTDYLPWLVDDIAWNINFLWRKVLTEEEKQQIKEILE